MGLKFQKLLTFWGAVAAVAAIIQLSGGAAAQEKSAPVDNAQPAIVHQVGIIRAGQKLTSDNLLSLPGFVHRSTNNPTTGGVWLDFSALYVIPPQMTTEPVTLRVRQMAANGGFVSAWYPYAECSPAGDTAEWTEVHAGVVADGLETTHPVWMQARAMEAAATLKVYKPGAAGTKRDDAGTTEGDVFLFARGGSPAAPPLTVGYDSNMDEWVINPPEDSIFPDYDNYVYAWWVNWESPEVVYSRIVQLAAADGKVLITQTPAKVDLATCAKTALEFRMRLNEALVGHGLRPDEASGLSALVLEAMAKVGGAAFVYVVPREWIDTVFPLEVRGQAKAPLRVIVGIAEAAK